MNNGTNKELHGQDQCGTCHAKLQGKYWVVMQAEVLEDGTGYTIMHEKAIGFCSIKCYADGAVQVREYAEQTIPGSPDAPWLPLEPPEAASEAP